MFGISSPEATASKLPVLQDLCLKQDLAGALGFAVKVLSRFHCHHKALILLLFILCKISCDFL